MTRLIFFVCVVVALLSVTFAAPLAEEESNAQQIIEEIDNLLMSADPEENNIAELIEATDSTAEAPTTSSPVKDDATVEVKKELAIMEKEIAVQATPTSASLVDAVVPSDVPTVEQEFQDTVEELIEKYGEAAENTPQDAEKQEDTVEKVQKISTNATKETDVKTATEQDEQLIPVTEIIPPPKRAFVLGEYADEQMYPEPAENNDENYKIVLGETEDGTPFVSEYQPDTLLDNQEEVSADAPLVEQTNYDYPEEPITPGAEYRPFQGPMADHSDFMYDDYNPGPRSGPSMDYNHEPSSGPDRDYVPDYETPNPDYDQNNDYFSGMNSPLESMNHEISFYQAHSPLDDMPNHADDSSPMPFDDSHDYDVVSNRSEEDDDMPRDTPAIDDDLPASMVTDHGNFPDVIVAGLHENYHPEPIPGMIPFTSESTDDNRGASYPTDAPILPSAMVNLGSPGAEYTRHQDDVMETPMPDIPSMVDIPRPVSEFLVSNQPMASMQPLDGDSMSSTDGNDLEVNEGNPGEYELAELAGRPTQPFNEEEETSSNDFDIDPQTGVVIQLDIESQQALVNGKPFSIKEPASILGFIGKMLEAARMSSSIPPRSDFSQGRMPNPYRYASSYVYPSSYDEETPSKQYQPSSFSHDYLPYNYFMRALRRRLLETRYNKMHSLDGGYGYDYTPMHGYNSIRGYDDSMQGYNSFRGYDDSMQGYNSFRGYDDSMQGYNSMRGYDDSMQEYNSNRGYDGSRQGYNFNRGYDDSMQGYNSIRGYDDSMQGYNPMQRYGQDYYQYW